MRSKLFKGSLIFFSVLILLFIGVAIFTQTAYFKSTVRTLTERVVGEALRQEFTIGQVEGNLVSGIVLKDVSLKIDGAQFLDISEVLVAYPILTLIDGSMLLTRTIAINDVAIDGVDLTLIKGRNGKWNFDRLGKGEDKNDGDNEEKGEEKEPSKWNIFIQNASLQDANVKYVDQAKNDTKNLQFNDFDLALNMLGITQKIEVNLKNGELAVSPNEISVTDISAKAVYEKNKAYIEDLYVNLNGTEIKFEGNVDDFKEPTFKFKASGRHFKFKNGVLNLEAEGEGKYKSPDDIQADFIINLPQSEIMGKKVSGTVKHLKVNGTKVTLDGFVKSDLGAAEFKGDAKLDYILKKEGINEFNFQLEAKDADLSKIPNLKQKPDIFITEGNFDIKGAWRTIDDLKATIDINKLRGSGNAGEFAVEGTILATKKNAKFDIISTLEKINAASFLGDEKYKSSINTNLTIRGSAPLGGEKAAEKVNATLNAKLLPSTFSDINIKSGNVDATYTGKELALKSLSLLSDEFTLKVKGEERRMNFAYDADIKDLSVFSKFLPEQEIRGALKAKGKVSGDMKNPRVTLTANGTGLGYGEDYEVLSADVKADGVFKKNNPQINANGTLEGIKVKSRNLESATFQAANEGKGIRAKLTVVENYKKNYEMTAKLADLSSKDKNITVEKIKLDLGTRIIENKQPINATISPDRAIVKSLNIYYKDNAILGDADIDFDGKVDAQIKIDKLDLSDLAEAARSKVAMKGTATGNIDLSGTMQDPKIEAYLTGSGLEYNKFTSDDVNLDLTYLNRRLTLDTKVAENGVETFSAKGTANVDLNFKKIGENAKKARFDITLKSNGVDLSPVAKFSDEIREISGKLIADLRATGNVDSLSINGNMKLQDVFLKIKTLRNEFKIVHAEVQMQGQRGVLKNTEIQTDDGKGKGIFSGEFNFGNLSYNLNSQLDNFLIQPQRITARVDGNVKVTGSDGKIDITGKAKVRNSRIKIPEQSPKKVEDVKFVDNEPEDEFTIEDTEETDFFKDKVAMNMDVNIPGNSWVKGRGANIDLRGDVGVLKRYGSPVIITGNIYTVRGTYEIFGKFFEIEEGTVTFQGTPEINPFLNIRAVYEVSDINIYVNITGTPEKPEIKLTSDNNMEETDIFSYLVFGTSSSNIGAGERVALQEKAGEILGNLALGELKDIVGGKLNLDVIRVHAGGTGTEFEAGKYITDDLYIAYELDSNSQSSTDASRSESSVRVEYRVFDFMSLESQIGGEKAGGDVFFKFDYSFPLLEK